MTESGTGKAEESHCSLSADKKTFVCAATNGTSYATRIAVKVTGVTFSNTDLTGPLSFNIHGIKSGGSSAADRGWEYETGTINSSRQISVTEYQKPDGAQTLPTANSSAFTVGADGFVTIRKNGTPVANWKGMLSSDKKMMIITSRNGGSPEQYGLFILTIADETFSGVSALAGDWRISVLWGGNDFGWAWVKATVNSSGVASMTSLLDSEGGTALESDETFSITSSGIVTDTAFPTFYGVLSHDRVISVASNDSDDRYRLYIWIR